MFRRAQTANRRLPTLARGASQSTELGAITSLKRSHCVLPRLLILSMLFSAAFCGGQTSAPASAPANQPAGQTAQSAGQSQGQSNDAQAAKDNSTNTSTASGGTSSAGTSKDRLFFALPNFLTLENAGSVRPLTTGQKYKVVAQGSFDPIQLVWYGALSGLSQAENREPGFGQGS